MSQAHTLFIPCNELIRDVKKQTRLLITIYCVVQNVHQKASLRLLKETKRERDKYFQNLLSF